MESRLRDSKSAMTAVPALPTSSQMTLGGVTAQEAELPKVVIFRHEDEPMLPGVIPDDGVRLSV
jgi:hypothetical protein